MTSDARYLDRFLADDDGRPVTMLNLLRFKPNGAERYRRYVTEARPLIEELGGTVLHAGSQSTPLFPRGGSGWDAVVLIEWPRRECLAELLSDPRYHPLSELRISALERAILEAGNSWDQRSRGR